MKQQPVPSLLPCQFLCLLPSLFPFLRNRKNQTNGFVVRFFEEGTNLDGNKYLLFIKDIYRSFAELARRKDITFTFESTEEKIDLWLDPLQMQKVLFNLLSNAFKYTPESGNIKITVKRIRQMVEIAVTDTGCGIPNEALSKIFERFYRGDEVFPDAVQGSGIGLAFTKAMIEAHKGTIKVESVWKEVVSK